MIRLKKWELLYRQTKLNKIFFVLMLYYTLTIGPKMSKMCMRDYMDSLRIKIVRWEKTLANKKILLWQKAIDSKVYLEEILLKKWVEQTQSAVNFQANNFIKFLYIHNSNQAGKSRLLLQESIQLTSRGDLKIKANS